MSKPIKIIAFVGKAGSGKSTAAKYVIEQYGFLRLSFSDGLKRMLHRGLEIDAEYLYGNKKKELCEELGGKTARHAMITLGTEWGRNLIHPDIWVKALEKQMFKLIRLEEDKFVIDDVRFLNEAAWIKRLKFLRHMIDISTTSRDIKDFDIQSGLIRIIRQSDIVIDHQSETEQDKILADYTLLNDKSIDHLYESVDKIVEKM